MIYTLTGLAILATILLAYLPIRRRHREHVAVLRSLARYGHPLYRDDR